MTAIYIREARHDEAALITAFQIDMAKETENIVLQEPVITAGVLEVFNDSTKGMYYVAESGNEVIACMLITQEWSDWRNGKFLWFQSVYVKPAFRGLGVFRAMYAYMKSMVESDRNLRGLRLYVFHTNKNAQAVYRSLGMEGQHYRMFEWVKEEGRI